MAEEGQLFEAPDGNTLRLVRITDDLLEMFRIATDPPG